MKPAVRSTIAGVWLAVAGSAAAQDFNGNAIRDSIDLRNGTSADCNHNGVPDEADLLKPDFAAAIEHFGDSATLSGTSGLIPVDVDQDGDIDVVVSSGAGGPNNSNVTVWRNDGGPGLVFGSRITITNAQCFAVRAADLNADGRMDIVCSDAGFPEVIVLVATGPGSFAAPLRLTAGSRGTGVTVDDLDGDGDLDIAAAGFATNAVDVFKNNGNATFAPRQQYACGQQPVAVASADFTGDGLMDLAVANSFISAPGTGTISLLRNNGGGTFVAHATISVAGHPETATNSAPHDVVLADVDADGDSDLLVSSKDSNSLRVYTNGGTGTFTNTQTLGPLESIGGSADRMLCADLDGDPALELAWCDSAARAVRIYDNNSGSFAFEQSYAAGTEGPTAVAKGDLDGDGAPELILGGATSNAFSTMVNQGGLNFQSVIHLRRSDSSFIPMLADFTGDGVTDLASYSTSTIPATFNIAPGIGNNRFGPAILVPLPSSGHMLPRDLNNDGLLDILSLGNSGNFFTKLNLGGGIFGPAILPYPIQLHGNQQTADINNDGNLDFLWSWGTASIDPHHIQIALGNGQGGFAPPLELITPPFMGDIWTGDLSGDGFPELFVGFASGQIAPAGLEAFAIYPNNGDGTFGPYSVVAYELVPNFASGVGAFAFLDIDNDGDKDVIAQSTRAFLYRNTQHQLEAPVMLGGFANYYHSQFGPTIYDADGDGDLDMFGARSISGVSSRAIFFNDGTGGFGLGDVGPCLAVMRYRNSPDHLAIGDADNNGWLDILAKPSDYADWYLHLNSQSTVVDCNDNGVPDDCEGDPCGGIAGDLDGNGRVDAADLAFLLSAWGTSGGGGSASADLDSDGIVAASDLAILLSAWTV